MGGRGLGQALLEFIDAAGRIDEFLGAGVKGVADVANADDDDGLHRAGLDDIPARATNFRVFVFWMCFSFHITKAENDTSNRGFDKSYFAEF